MVNEPVLNALNPVDWTELIHDLLDSGETQKSIGEAIGRSQPYVADILKGRYADLKHFDGEKVRAFHRQKFPDKYKPLGGKERRSA